jgi:hypothetical protein
MTKDSIASLYSRGRSFPRGQVREHSPRPPSADGYDRHQEIQRPQAPEDQRGPGYSNDVSKKSWLQSGTATDKPGFDKGQDGKQSWRAGREKSLNWRNKP